MASRPLRALRCGRVSRPAPCTEVPPTPSGCRPRRTERGGRPSRATFEITRQTVRIPGPADRTPVTAESANAPAPRTPRASGCWQRDRSTVALRATVDPRAAALEEPLRPPPVVLCEIPPRCRRSRFISLIGAPVSTNTSFAPLTLHSPLPDASASCFCRFFFKFHFTFFVYFVVACIVGVTWHLWSSFITE